VLQLAFTMVWMTIISQLGYYKILYGPQVLLQMNIAYFLPSIPLLGLSSQFDERLDQKFGKLHCKSLTNSLQQNWQRCCSYAYALMAAGVARTILVRLLIGLGGCALICAAIPFEPTNLRCCLGAYTHASLKCTVLTLLTMHAHLHV